MAMPAPNKHQILETITDWLKILGLIGFPLWIIIFLIYCLCVGMCQDTHYRSEPTCPPYRTEDIYQHRPAENTGTAKMRTVIPVQSEENKLIDNLSREDYYDYSDYYDGLDGEYNDIDYNEVVDYFAD